MHPDTERRGRPDEIRERPASRVEGRLIARLSTAAFGGAIVALLFGIDAIGGHHAAGAASAGLAPAVALLLIGASALRGLVRVPPGEAVVLLSFGRYVGTLREPGFWWARPWADRRRVSTKIRSHETLGTKVNDADGNPIEMSAVVMWRVADTAKALFEVEDFGHFMSTQCDAALRELAAGYRYDNRGDGSASLSGSAIEVTDQLTLEISHRVSTAGLSVLESRIVRIAYAPEIAQAMLRRQQAGAIVSARQQIVEGAVGMVELALNRLDEENVVELDEERKAAMVSNLLVVLCSDHPTQPILNAGSLYH
ncbi:MAG: SPFH domain-containing protein [Acidimicrobiales bacterium]